LTRPHPGPHHPKGKAIFKPNPSPVIHQHYSNQFILHTPTCLWRWNRQSVPKRWHINFRRRGITQKKAYNI
jgi:hypothetical protein